MRKHDFPPSSDFTTDVTTFAHREVLCCPTLGGGFGSRCPVLTGCPLMPCTEQAQRIPRRLPLPFSLSMRRRSARGLVNGVPLEALTNTYISQLMCTFLLLLCYWTRRYQLDRPLRAR